MKQQTKSSTRKEQSGNKQETRGTKAGWEKDPRKTGNANRNNAGRAQEQAQENIDTKGLDIDEEETAGNRPFNSRQNQSNQNQADLDQDEDDAENITAQTVERGARADKAEFDDEDEDEIEGSGGSFNRK